jgi:hypothetical protein
MSDAQQRREPLVLPPAAPPQAFLSYAWESDSHANWVFNLATKLQESGVRIIFDQWDLPLGSDQFYFMERSIEKSDFVIVICTPAYAQKPTAARAGLGMKRGLSLVSLPRRLIFANLFLCFGAENGIRLLQST